jgi:hypothetical protein
MRALGWLDDHRRWLIAAFAVGYVTTLFGEYILMHSGFGERQSASECWFGDWVVRADNALIVAGFALSLLTPVAVARLWRLQGIIWRVGATVGLTVVAAAVWWMFWLSWSFDSACGL